MENLQGKSNYLIANDGKGTSILTIRKVNLKSYGTYNCTVVNSLFGTTQTVSFMVIFNHVCSVTIVFSILKQS